MTDDDLDDEGMDGDAAEAPPAPSGGPAPAPVPQPTGLAGIVGQGPAVAALRAALTADRLAHGYAFLGPPGAGRCTTARALAAALLCPRSPAPGEGCGVCPDCAAVRRGDHPDCRVAAPPEGRRALPIALVQEVCAELALRPARGPRRVAILDGADRATEEAANALLKTLEEPPGRSVLLLVVEDLSALPATIRSRCQVVRFGPLPRAAIAERLRAAGLSPAEADARAARAEGSLGAALRAAPGEAADAGALLAPLPRRDGAALTERAEAVLARCRAGAENAEAVRAAAAALCAVRIADERVTLRAALAGARPDAPAGRSAERRLRALLAARRALRANASPDLVIETLLLELTGA